MLDNDRIMVKLNKIFIFLLLSNVCISQNIDITEESDSIKQGEFLYVNDSTLEKFKVLFENDIPIRKSNYSKARKEFVLEFVYDVKTQTLIEYKENDNKKIVYSYHINLEDYVSLIEIESGVDEKIYRYVTSKQVFAPLLLKDYTSRCYFVCDNSTCDGVAIDYFKKNNYLFTTNNSGGYLYGNEKKYFLFRKKLKKNSLKLKPKNNK